MTTSKYDYHLKYLERLLDAYIKLVPYDTFRIEVEKEENDNLWYVRIEFLKKVKALTSENMEVDAYNRSEKRFMITEIRKAIQMFKQKFNYEFKNRHNNGTV